MKSRLTIQTKRYGTQRAKADRAGRLWLASAVYSPQTHTVKNAFRHHCKNISGRS